MITILTMTWKGKVLAPTVEPDPEKAFVVRAAFRGQRLMVAKLRRAYVLARTSVGVKDGVQALQLALDRHIATVQHLQQQIEQTEQALTDLLLTLPEAKYMLSVPSLGTITAATILSEIGDPRSYRQVN